MKISNYIEKNISSMNKKIVNKDKENIVIIFQFITMTGIVAITAFLLYFTITRITTDIDFKTVLPIIPLNQMLEQRSIDRMYADQIVGEIYDLYTPLEIDFFIKTYSKRDYQDKLKNVLFGNINRLDTLLSYDIDETHQEFGTSLYDEETGDVILTDSRFLMVVKEKYISDEKKVTSDERAIVVDITLDKDRTIRALKIHSDHILIDKHKFANYLLSVNGNNIKNNLSYKSPMTPLSMSFMKIETLTFGDLKIGTNTDGDPIGHSIVSINGERYMATVEYAKSGNPILIVE